MELREEFDVPAVMRAAAARIEEYWPDTTGRHKHYLYSCNVLRSTFSSMKALEINDFDLADMSRDLLETYSSIFTDLDHSDTWACADMNDGIGWDDEDRILALCLAATVIETGDF